MTVLIKGKEYEFSFDSIWGPLYTYEVMAGKSMPFNPESTLCLHIMYYCILYRANQDFTLSFDDYMESLNNIDLVRDMNKYYVERMEVLTEEANEDEKKKKERIRPAARKN